MFEKLLLLRLARKSSAKTIDRWHCRPDVIAPGNPIIPSIQGDGTSVDLGTADRMVFDENVANIHGKNPRAIEPFKIYAEDDVGDLYRMHHI
jgi:isocitrate dehydrogenase